ncbi:MAG TPA: hypothetical protein VMG12_10100 [Polyangiaceae bacterium]|nr:hypothetical protein [Polyangiaceae bacterium]
MIRGTAIGRRGLEWLRATAASVALFALLGVGHLLPALHFALVAHRICAEHGELVHEAEPAPAAESRSSAPELVAGVHAAHEHEHCGVLALPSSAALPPSAPARDARLAGEPIASDTQHERPAHVGIALLLYAPKLAPPS